MLKFVVYLLIRTEKIITNGTLFANYIYICQRFQVVSN